MYKSAKILSPHFTPLVFFLFLLLSILLFVNGEQCYLSASSDYDYMVDISDNGINGDIRLDFSIISDNSDETNDLLSVQLTLGEKAWLGFGLSYAGNMIGSEAVIGKLDVAQGSTNPGKYDLLGKSNSQVVLMDAPHQTLIDASLVQNSTTTIMRFKKKLVEDDEIVINKDGVNTFLWAYGFSNSLSYHKNRSPFTVDFTECYSLKLKCKDEDIV